MGRLLRDLYTFFGAYDLEVRAIASRSAGIPPLLTAPWPQAKRWMGNESSLLAEATAVALLQVPTLGKNHGG